MAIDFKKTPANEHISVFVGPTGSPLGIADVWAPTADEVNNAGDASGVQPAHQSISWNDYDFGIQASETTNEPSLADAASYEEFGASNFGGAVSYYYPENYDDNSNLHSVIYDITDELGELNDFAVRIDGALKTSVPVADGDFISVYRVEVGSEANPFTPGESKRRTVTYIQKDEFSHFTVVGDHEITAIAPAEFAVGDKGRIRASIQGRDVTNMLSFLTSDGDVVNVYPGGFYEVTGEGTATVTISDVETGDSTTVEVSTAVAPEPVAPTITSGDLPDGTIGESYNFTVTASGDATITFSATGLPDGLNIDSASGEISGTPTTDDTYEVEITATNSAGSDSETYEVTIDPEG